mgnify:CR=1 FL=1
MVECGALSGRALWPLVNTVVCRDGSGVLVWWLMRGRHRRREDDEIDSGDVE